MIPVTQTILLGDPSGERGNCFAACIASILELPIEQVPNFCNHDDWRLRTNEWLSLRGLAYLDVNLVGDARDELVRFWGYHVISGDGPRGVRHAVVGLRGEIVWDPHPTRAGLLDGPEAWDYGLFVRTFEAGAHEMGSQGPS